MKRLPWRNAPVIVTVTLAMIGTCYWLWSVQAGQRKLTDSEVAVAAKMSGRDDRIDIQILLPFTPEQFHFMQLQEYGRMAGADKNSVSLRNVKIESAQILARQYWIADIVPLEPQ